MSFQLRSLYGTVAVVALAVLAAISSFGGARAGDAALAAAPLAASPAAAADHPANAGPAGPATAAPRTVPVATSTPVRRDRARPSSIRTPASAARTDRLPTTTPRTLPPMIRLRSGAGGSGAGAALRAQVLAERRLVLAPRSRAALEGGRVTDGALRLLLDAARGGGPLLVFKAHGGAVLLQATTHLQTRRTVVALRRLPARQAPAALRLLPTPPDFADAHTGVREARSSGALGLQAARLATRYLGVPYVWGGASPRGLDCSGLTMLVYAQLGVPLDHYAAFQWLEGERIAADSLRAGDLVFFNPKADGPGHMGLYLGGDRFIHAPRTGDVVKVSVLSERAGSYLGAVRPF